MVRIIVIGDSGVGKTSMVRRALLGDWNPKDVRAGPTIGAAFQKHEMPRPAWASRNQLAAAEDGDGSGPPRKVALEFWDTAGAERFHSIVPLYFRQSDVVVFCADPASPQTVEHLKEWHYRVISERERWTGRQNHRGDPLFAEVPLFGIVALTKADRDADGADNNKTRAAARRRVGEWLEDSHNGDIATSLCELHWRNERGCPMRPPVLDVSAKTGQGIDELMELVTHAATLVELERESWQHRRGFVGEELEDAAQRRVRLPKRSSSSSFSSSVANCAAGSRCASGS